MFGFGGADVLVDGAGNDTINGGADNDTLIGGMGDVTAVFTVGAREDYLIWQTGTGNTQQTHVVHMFNTDNTGDNLSRDTLTGVEMIQIGSEAAVMVSGLTFDNALLMVADDAPTSLAGRSRRARRSPLMSPIVSPPRWTRR